MRKYFLSNRGSVVVVIFSVLLLCSTTTLIPVIDANENKDVTEKYKCIHSIKTREVSHRFYDNLINQDVNEKYSESFASDDFKDYWDMYVKVTDYWLGNINDTWYQKFVNTVFSTWQADNYYDWHEQVNDGVEDVWIHFQWLLILSFALSIVIAASGAGIISPFVWLICFIPGYECAAGMGYAFNGVNIFQKLQEKEVNIIIHVVNETGVGIPALDYGDGIKAWNREAVYKCENEYNNTGAFDKTKFEYYMRTIKGNDSEQGWYSLSARSMPKYEKAVCPPGLWNITIDGNDIYKPKDIDVANFVGNIGNGDTVVLDNITLDRWYPPNQ